MAGEQQPPVAPQTPSVGGAPVAFDRPSADATRDAVRYYQRAQKNSPQPPTRRPGQGFDSGGTLFRITSTVSARSGSSYGTGTGVMLYDNGSTLADSTETIAAGVPLKNITDKTLASGSSNYAVCVWANGGWWVVAVAVCP